MARKKSHKTRYQRIGFIPDTHVPYHDPRAWKLVRKVWAHFRPHGTVIGGDFLDNYPLSRHRKDPTRKETFLNGVLMARDMLRKDIEPFTGPLRKFIKGNHDRWFDNYFMDNAPELYEFFKDTDLLELKTHGWEVTEYMDHTKIGEIYLTHDDGQTGVNAVRSALKSYGDNIIINHIHRMNYVVETNSRGKAHIAASFGWLGDAKYATYTRRKVNSRDWSLGFGWGILDSWSGTMYITPVPLVNYTCCVEGEIFH